MPREPKEKEPPRRSNRKRVRENPDPEAVFEDASAKFEVIRNDLKNLVKNNKNHRSPSSSEENRGKKRFHSEDREDEKSENHRCFCSCVKAMTQIVDFQKKSSNAANDENLERLAAALRLVAAASSSSVEKNPRHALRVEELLRIVREGLGDDATKDLVEKYSVENENSTSFKVPTLNVPIAKIIDAKTTESDRSLAMTQNLAGVQISTIQKNLKMISPKEEDSAEIAGLAETLQDIGRANAEMYHAISKRRRIMIVDALGAKEVEEYLGQPIGETLFSAEAAQELARQKAVQEVEKNFQNKIAILLRGDAAQTRRTEVAPINESAGTSVIADGPAEAPQDAAVATASTSRKIKQEFAANIAQPAVAKVEGIRVTGEAGVIMNAQSGGAPTPNPVPTNTEVYPGPEVVAERAFRQRGGTGTFRNVQEKTWKNYNFFIEKWWNFCRHHQKNVAQPDMTDLLRFLGTFKNLSQTKLDVCRFAMKKVLAQSIMDSPEVKNALQQIKGEVPEN